MKKYQRGISYLEFIREGSKPWRGIYKCLICLNEREFNNYRIKSGHTKTCGCKNGHQPLDYNITKDGYIVSKGGYDISSRIANGYIGFNKQYVHRLVAEKFIPNPNGFTDVNHIDGNKHNNNPNNLEWCSRSHNIKHAWDTNLNNGGTGKVSKKRQFTDEQIREIRASKNGCVFLSREYGVSKTTILNIRNNKTYTNIETKYLKG